MRCLFRLAGAAVARDIQKHLFKRRVAIFFQQSGRAVAVHDAALFHHHHLVAQAFDLGHVVGCEKNGRPLLFLKVFQIGMHPVGRVGIERGRRFVEQQKIRFVQQGFRERHPGLLPR